MTVNQEPLFKPTVGADIVFSVAEFLDFVNETLGQQDFSVQGEVTSFKVHPSGVYFSLKDKGQEALLDCYMSPYLWRGLGIIVEEGMEVRVSGTPNIYKPKGRFSFRVQALEIAGEGALKKQYELLKKRLQDEGLFDRKRPLPEFIRSVGLITSRTGAVIDDFRKNIARRGFTLMLSDVRVEGSQAAGMIVRAVRRFNRSKSGPDVLVIMRGGGSLEDLAAFNDEAVARTIFASRIPTICAIGHDRDVPIAALVGDAATSTPTAAATLVNVSWQRLTDGLPVLSHRLGNAFSSALTIRRSDIDGLSQRLATHLQRMTSTGMLMAQRLAASLDIIGRQIAHARETVAAYERHLYAASPERNLKLGYSIVSDASGRVIRSITQVHVGQELTARLSQGSIESHVTNITKEK